MTAISPISFDDYSRKYDMLLTYSPPYQAIGQHILSELQKKYSVHDSFTLLDVGGGTGNFAKIVQDAFPNVEIHLLEPNDAMRAIAQQKLQKIKIHFVSTSFEQYQSPQSFDVVLCIHALYLMPQSKQLIPKFKDLMHAQSLLLICDIGQVINVRDWTIYLFRENLKKHGLLKTIQFWRLASEIKVANRAIEKQQRGSTLWSHTLEEFKEWFSEYYNILTAFNCYRGCSNFLVCELP